MKSRTKRITCYIGLGSNRGNRLAYLTQAIQSLSSTKNVRVVTVSSLYETSPIGGPRQRAFLNAVAKVETRFAPLDFLKILQRTEKQLGRIRETRWGPRTIDLDVLTWGRRKLRLRRLTIPHPRYANRRFVLVPFSEISPQFVHPQLKKQNRTLLRELTLIGQRVTIWSRWKKQPSYRYNKRKPRKSRSRP